MDVFYTVLAILLFGVMMLGVFIMGALFMRSIVRDAQEEARHDALKYEYYRLAGVQKPTDPRPYVPPRPYTPRARSFLPGMGKLDRLLHEGKRGTVMWRAGDRKSAG